MGILSRLFGKNKKRPSQPRERNMRFIRANALDSAASPNESAAYWSFASNAVADEIANAQVRKKLRARCRYEYLNDGYAQNAARNLAISVVGCGPRLQIHAEREVAESIEKEFQRWAKEVRLAEKLDLAVRSLVFDGESFFRFVSNDRVSGQVDIELIDAGRVTSETVGASIDENVLDGIRYDDYGRPIFYTVSKASVNPLYSNIPMEFEQVPAEDMLHLFIPDLPGQHRGLPLLQSSLQTLGALRRYNAAVIEAAETAAAHAVLIHTQHLPDGSEPDEAEAMDEVIVPRRGGMFLPKGWIASQMKPEQPTAQHSDFISVTLTGIGAGVGQPRNIISNDSSNYNYSSGRLDHQTFFRYVETIQQRLTYLLDVMLDNVLLTLGMESVSEREDVATEWYFAELAHVDPKKEADAAVQLLNAGLLTRKEYFAKFGQDWEQQAEQLEKERERFPVGVNEVTKDNEAIQDDPDKEPDETGEEGGG